MSETDAILSIEQLTLAHRRRRSSLCVEAISLALHPRQILCVVGESGSGKTVCASAVMGLLPNEIRRSQGHSLRGTRFAEIAGSRVADTARAAIAMIFQEPMTALNPVIRIGDQIMEAFERMGTSRWPNGAPARARSLRKWDCAIWSGSSTAIRISFRRSASARHDCDGAGARTSILVADEPTTALDVTTRRRSPVDPRHPAAAWHGRAVHHP